MNKNININDYDLLVVGCGFTGGIIAYLAANRLNKKVLIVDKRSHIAGNMYDELDEETGILIQRYGPHSFHTESEEVYRLLCEIGEWEPFILRARVEVQGKNTPSPFNFKTVDDFFSPKEAHKIKTHLANSFSYRPKVTITEMMSSQDPIVREYAQFLYREDYCPYTAKQWGIKPDELDISVLQRVPVRLSYDDRYFDDRFQMQPKGGYTKFFKKMLLSSNIRMELNTDIREHLTLQDNGTILFDDAILKIPMVYTGALDELFECSFGKLPYRSLSFDYQTISVSDFQETPGVAYPFAEKYTRITEFSKLMPLPPKTGKTIIAYEYPVQYGNGNEPYYPILTQESSKIYEKYCELAEKYPLLYYCGRLGDFKYYNMDNAILRAMEIFEKLPLV